MFSETFTLPVDQPGPMIFPLRHFYKEITVHAMIDVHSHPSRNSECFNVKQTSEIIPLIPDSNLHTIKVLSIISSLLIIA